MLRGFTAHGPHRDDLKVLINNKMASETASRGETRTILLALKLIETQVVEEARQQKPLLLFDDVFSELDGARRLALTKILSGYQTIITTTDADVVVQRFMGSNNIIPLN
jgi:DNA replication and repair protein RecF